MINIFIRDDIDNDETCISSMTYTEWDHCNFFDNDTRIGYNHNPTKIPFNIMKQLLFRGIPPFQITNRKFIYDYEIDKYDDLNIIQQCKLFNNCFHKTIDKVNKNEDIFNMTTVTMPFIICDIANVAKMEMYQILDGLLKDIITNDCIECILSFIYMNWNKLLPNIDNENILIKAG
eukprot:446241_1